MEKTITVKREWLEAVASLVEACATLVAEKVGLHGQPPEEILLNVSRAVKETVRIHTQ